MTFLSIGIYGMYQGIEIKHPLFALLFSNLIFPNVATFLNFLVLAFFPFKNWVRMSMFSNFLSLLFHTTSWSIISVLRYIHIEHQDWLNDKWPDITKLQPVVLVIQFLAFFLLLLTNVVGFALFASPYGWPAKSFLKYVPPNIQIFLSIFAVSVFTLPVIVSGIFYILLGALENKNRQSQYRKS
jgi:hypothetical protein